MRRTLHCPLALTLLLAGHLLPAQTLTENYIELTVTDTISSKVERIVYTYTPEVAEMHSDAVYEESEDWEKVQKKIEAESREKAEKLKAKLAKQGFKTTDAIVAYEDYTISTYEEENQAANVYVELATEAELKRLVAYLRSEGKGDGQISEWKYETSSGSETELMQRLHQRAEEQAKVLATMGGRKLGKLLAAHAPGSSTGMPWLDSILELAKQEIMKGEFGARPDLQHMRQRALTFRFALTD